MRDIFLTIVIEKDLLYGDCPQAVSFILVFWYHTINRAELFQYWLLKFNTIGTQKKFSTQTKCKLSQQ